MKKDENIVIIHYQFCTIFQAITSITIGSVCGRLKCQRQLDSYTEEDLNILREKWSEALKRRRMYLDQQVSCLVFIF